MEDLTYDLSRSLFHPLDSNRGMSHSFPLHVAGMLMHADNAAVCNTALSALVNVSAYVDRNLVLEIASGELDAIVNAMRNHQSSKSIQQNAVIVLKSLASCRANVRVMEQNQYLVPMIYSAKSTWRTLQGRADELLRTFN